MKKRAIVLLVVFAVAALAAAGLAACGDGDWLEGTYEYSECSIDYDANIDLGGMDMEAIMGDTYEKMFNGATMTFEKDEVIVNMMGVTTTNVYKLDGDKIVMTEGDLNLAGMASASQEMRVEGDSIVWTLNMDMSAMMAAFDPQAKVTMVAEYVFTKAA